MALITWLKDRMLAKLTKERESNRGALCDFDRITQEIIPGDVLLVEGRSRISDIIRNVTNSTWTHASLYIGRLHSIEDPDIRELVHKAYSGGPSEQLLIESEVGVGTIIRPITFYEEDHLRICRPHGISKTDAQKAIANAVQHLGRQYDSRQIFDLVLFMLANPFIPSRWHSNLFRNSNPDVTTKEICSTMIAQAFASVKFPILPVATTDNDTNKKILKFEECNPKLITPREFDYSPYFDIIKYPIFGDRGGYYKHMPWAETEIESDPGSESDTNEEDNK